MITSRRSMRGLVAFGLAIGLVVGACGSSSGTGSAGGNGGNGGGGSALASGLASNLDTLDSYQFSWQYSASATGASAGDTGAVGTSGTVVNKPAKAYKINAFGLQVIVVGSQGWTSFDNGSSWMASTDYSSDSSSLKDLLPTSLYGNDFDTNVASFTVKGDETKNGVACVHFTGNSNLGAAGAVLGVGATFQSDLWVAKSGNYPVSGFYGWTVTSNGQSGTWGYQFDVTHVNDAAANTVTAPTNVVALPS